MIDEPQKLEPHRKDEGDQQGTHKIDEETAFPLDSSRHATLPNHTALLASCALLCLHACMWLTGLALFILLENCCSVRPTT